MDLFLIRTLQLTHDVFKVLNFEKHHSCPYTTKCTCVHTVFYTYPTSANGIIVLLKTPLRYKTNLEFESQSERVSEMQLINLINL